MDVVVTLCLFGSIFALPAGLLILVVNPKLRRLGAILAILSAIVLAVSATMVWMWYR